MASWPQSLPIPKITGYNSTDDFRHIATEMESGPRYRVRVSGNYMQTFATSLVMDQAQAAVFRQLLIDSSDGAEWIDGVPLDTGGGPQPHRARISGVTWRVIKPNDVYDVAVSFESEERN